VEEVVDHVSEFLVWVVGVGVAVFVLLIMILVLILVFIVMLVVIIDTVSQAEWICECSYLHVVAR
jgi:hypothetical protein